MNNIEKILNLIKTNKIIAENLFMYAGFPEDIKLYTGYEEDNHDYANIKWLFKTHHQNLTFVGINLLYNTIWTIDDEGDFHQDCDSLQDLPYEIIRIDCAATENETVEDYFNKYKEYDFKGTLQSYEQWCKNNNIELDKNKIYHDENGVLFDKYFDKD